MVLVRTETGQLVMVPQHVLAQAQAKMQQGQTVANIAQRPTTPTAATAAIRVSTATTVSRRYATICWTGVYFFGCPGRAGVKGHVPNGLRPCRV